MMYSDNQYVTARDLSFIGILNDVKKSKTALQPIFEAFTNALEAIKTKAQYDDTLLGKIEIQIHATENTIQTSDFTAITIRDNGIGFDDSEFIRFNTFKDSSKGFKNIGSGRIQFVHYFDNTNIKSVFYHDGHCFEREFSVSKKKVFLDNNSIVHHRYCREIAPQDTGTIVSFNTLLEHSNIYNNLNEITLKEHLLKRYIHYFCHNKSNLPDIIIKFFVQSVLKGNSSITISDVPNIDKSDNIVLPYKRISTNGKSMELSEKTEKFTIDSFKIDGRVLETNDLKLVSKGEIVEESDVVLQNLSKIDQVNGYKYLFLISSEYIDARDTNIRGVLNIPTIESINKNINLFKNEEIFIEEIQNGVNDKINLMYPEISEVKQLHDVQIDKLKEMFFLDEESLGLLNVSINDSETKILERFYEAEAKKTAALDASIKESYDNLNKLDTTNPAYNENLKKEINKLVKAIPQQNRKSLVHYVARRKLILELFSRILDQQLDVQQNSRNYDESLIHNLLFQQGTDNPEDSDLWIISEDFIYFNGSSEKQLSKIEISGELLFKDTFLPEEERYLNSLGEKRALRRPDVLLFPEEGKCIIIEFKAPDVNVSDHLTQIDRYAGLIRNFTNDKFEITTFYGYLIGESIEPRDVLGAVSRYEHSYQFDYLYRPSENVIGFDGRTNGSIYSEVIKYSTLLERAKRRNKIFIEKLHNRKL